MELENGNGCEVGTLFKFCVIPSSWSGPFELDLTESKSLEKQGSSFQSGSMAVQWALQNSLPSLAAATDDG